MKRMLMGLLLLGACSPVGAGVYDLEEHPRAQGAGGWNKIDTILALRAVPVAPPKGKDLDPDSLRALYLQQVARLESIGKQGALSTVDSANLAGAYIRLGKTREALNVLLAADQGHFLVQANLAGAYQSTATWRAALIHQRKALSLWPEVWAGWSRERLEFYRECEQCNLRLIEARANEPQQTTPRLDSIFHGVRFFLPGDRNVVRVPIKDGDRKKGPPHFLHYFRGERGARNVIQKDGAAYLAEPDGVIIRGMRFVAADGKYHAGQLDPRMAALLPRNAGALVAQLALWQPQDLRVCWLLGELLNAEGYLEGAFRMLGPTEATRGWAGDERSKHRSELERALKAYEVLKRWQGQGALMSQVLLVTRPFGTLAAPGAGAAADRLGALAPQVLGPALDVPPLAASSPGQPVTASRPLLPFNLRHVVFSFISGFVMAALLGLQVQQWRRRRQVALDFQEPAPNTATAGDEAAVQPRGGAHVLDPGPTATAAGWPHPDRSEGMGRVP